MRPEETSSPIFHIRELLDLKVSEIYSQPNSLQEKVIHYQKVNNLSFVLFSNLPNMNTNITPFASILLICYALLSTGAYATREGVPGCRGTATYRVVFSNLLTSKNFGNLIPSSGLVFSPLAGVSHSNRISFFTVRGFASKPVEILAEQGRNMPFINLARRVRRKTGKVTSVIDAGKPTMPGTATVLTLKVNCFNPSITVLGMIAPSPDWIVQINNRIMYDTSAGRFIGQTSGDLIAYDTGVDNGREFTPPLDLSLDLPTVPRKNIAPLVEDDTDRFEGRVVGKYLIKRIH